jgi:lysophospholipase L1-like esterase
MTGGPTRRARSYRALLAVAALALGACGRDAVAARTTSAPPDATHWVTTWATSPQADDPEDAKKIHGQTLRQVVRVSLGGGRIQVRFSNAFGTQPLAIGSAHVALHEKGSAIVAASDRAMTFAGTTAVKIAPGAFTVTDPVAVDVAPLAELAVSVFLPEDVVTTTVHGTAQATTYWSRAGDFTGAPVLEEATTTTSWYNLGCVEVQAASAAGTIVALGDSLTDGMKSTVDAHHCWPEFLADRLNARRDAPPRAVVNAGISGNRVLDELVGPSALARLDRDVLGVPGVSYVVFEEGANDLATHAPKPDSTPEELIAGLRQVIERTHARGLGIAGGTIPPFEGATFGLKFTPTTEAARQAVNAWIRTGGAYDAVLDFDRVLRDPSHPTRILPAYDSGDHAHPNDAGYKAMADAIDTAIFAPRR